MVGINNGAGLPVEHPFLAHWLITRHRAAKPARRFQAGAERFLGAHGAMTLISAFRTWFCASGDVRGIPTMRRPLLPTRCPAILGVLENQRERQGFYGKSL